MAKRIGFIDYYIDEWHANNYPRMIQESSWRDRFTVSLAWDEGPRPGKKSLADWCAEHGVTQARSQEQVVAECDCLVVLSPDNGERHEALAQLALRSGKPVYIDKPFAPDLATASRLFALAAAHQTPMMSCSALRFGSELQGYLRGASGPAQYAAVRGGGVFEIYAIHQLEMLVMLMGSNPSRVMQVGPPSVPTMVVEYPDGRRSSIMLMPGHSFQVSILGADGKATVLSQMPDFFPRFIDAMLAFLDSGKSPIPTAETLAIAALIEAGTAALATPERWVAVPQA